MPYQSLAMTAVISSRLNLYLKDLLGLKRVYLCAGELQYLELGVTSGVAETSLPLVDDFFSDPITIPTGFPLFGRRHSTVFVSCKASSPTLHSTTV